MNSHALAASSARSQVIVQLDAGASADAVKAQVREYGGRVNGEFLAGDP